MSLLRSRSFVLSAALGAFGALGALGATACSDGGGETGGAGGSAGAGGAAGAAGGGGTTYEPSWPNLACDPLVPTYCGFPFPNNVFTVVDESTPTGRRVSLDAMTGPENVDGVRGDPVEINRSDGFSPGIEMLAHLPGATQRGLPGPHSIELSLESTSPTILIEAETLDRVPHFAEIDARTTDDERRAFSIRPVIRLKDSTRYIVAIRDVVDTTGAALEPAPAFQALRDGDAMPSEPSVDDRRDLYEDIFDRLGRAGVERDGLQLAWDFTTASAENNTAWMVHMRDEAFDLVGPDGPEYVIDQVVTDGDPGRTAYEISGRMTVPLYLTNPEDPGASRLIFGDDGMPEPNPDRPTYEVPFDVIIPESALTAPAGVVQYGHGLFGSRGQIGAGHFRDFMNTYGYVFAGVDLIGMAADDPVSIGITLFSGKTENIVFMFDRLHQGMLNQLLCLRMMIGGFAKDPMFGATIDPTRRYYHGISQGGISGLAFVALSPDVTRGALGVMGQSYNMLLSRSVDFQPFFDILAQMYEDPRDVEMMLALVQLLWDRMEPTGYSPFISGEPLPGSSPSQLLLRAAVGDHQVTTLGAHIMARSIDAAHVDTGVRPIWGLENVDSVQGQSALVEYEFGLPAEPTCNVPNDLCDDPHGKLRSLAEAQSQLDRFFRTGEIRSDCAGACSFPALSGCPPGADQVDQCADLPQTLRDR